MEIPVELAGKDELHAAAERNDERIYSLEPGQPELRVLAVDDEPDNLAVLERLLKTAGFHIRVAPNGEGAVAAFESWQPHFIWMDLRMPEIDGMEAVRRIRAITGGAEVKIAALTASASERDRVQVMSGGFNDFVRKPFGQSEIFDCMARHLGIRYRTEKVEIKPSAPVIGIAAGLAALPVDLRGELRNAVTMLDAKGVNEVIKRIGEHDAVLSATLSQMAERFAYTAMLNGLGPDRAASA